MGMDVGAKKGPRSDINITPLVDVVLVLLIIFMVLTPMLERENAVRLPEPPDPVANVAQPAPEPLQVSVKPDEAAHIHINSETLTDENAVDRLKVWYRAAKSKEAMQGPPVIFFDADDKAKYSRAMKGLDLIRDSSPGWTIGMMTEKLASAATGTEPTPPGGAPGAPGAPAAPGAPGTPEAPPPAKPQ